MPGNRYLFYEYGTHLLAANDCKAFSVGSEEEIILKIKIRETTGFRIVFLMKMP